MRRPALIPLGPERLVAIDGDVPAGALRDGAALRLGEREVLVVDAEAAELPALPAALAVDVGDSYEGWRLAGADALELLAKACPLDPAGMTAGAATRSVMAGVTVVLSVRADGDWELRVERSYAAWLEAWLRQL